MSSNPQPDSTDEFVRSWRNAAHLHRWFDNQWPELRHDELRNGWDSDGRWYCIFPDYEAGKSRVVGVEAGVLRRLDSVEPIREALASAQWRRILLQAPLLVVWSEDELQVVPWEPELKEQWFPLPGGGHFVVYETTSRAVSAGPVAMLPETFLALDGKTWCAMGPAAPRDPRTYTYDELRGYLPEDVASSAAAAEGDGGE